MQNHTNHIEVLHHIGEAELAVDCKPTVKLTRGKLHFIVLKNPDSVLEQFRNVPKLISFSSNAGKPEWRCPFLLRYQM